MNGVKQWGVLSPTFFGIYIWRIYWKNYKIENVGCYVDPYFVGSLAYADDLVYNAYILLQQMDNENNCTFCSQYPLNMLIFFITYQVFMLT